MNDWIEIPLGLGILLLCWYLFARFGGLVRFARWWLAGMALFTIGNAIFFSYWTTGFRTAFVYGGGGFAIWILLWIPMFFVYCRQGSAKPLSTLLALPVLYLIIVRSSSILTTPQVEHARAQGDVLIDRLEDYREVHKAYPASLVELQEFDGLAIPEIQVGLGPSGRIAYDSWEGDPWYEGEDGFTLSFAGFVGVRHYRDSEDEDWWSED